MRTGAVVALAFLFLVAGWAGLARGRAAWAEGISAAASKGAYDIEVEASLDPVDLKPGERGMLIVRFVLRGHQKVEKPNLTWRPLPVDGVTYEIDKALLPAPEAWTDEWGDPKEAWKESFDLRVPVQIAKDARPGSRIGLEVTYVVCDDMGCGAPKDARTTAMIGGLPTISPPVAHRSGAAQLKVQTRADGSGGVAMVTLLPARGWHFYLPGSIEGEPITVEPMEAPGVDWGQIEIPTGERLDEPLEVRVPFQRDPKALELGLRVTWVGCDDVGRCDLPREAVLRASWLGEDLTPAPVPEGASEASSSPATSEASDLAFPVVEGDILPESGSAAESDIGGLLHERGLLAALGVLFLIGAGLAFTPCVFPLIPIVVATIGGGRDLPRPRLAALLGTYVLGLSLTFAAMGIASAFGGASMSAAFESQLFQWGFAVLFLIFALGMLGVFELQPPQWLQRLQGGAQHQAGSFLGAFLLGVLGAILASPCTGPVIAGLLVFSAQAQDAVLGFLLFFVLGLGMGAVLFAFGALNFALRPGPWMVWVRYVFGVLLFGAAFYYIGKGELIQPFALYVGAGVALAALLCLALVWHLRHRERESSARAWRRALPVLGLFLVGLAAVAFWNRPLERKVPWRYVGTPEALVAEIARAQKEGKPVLVDFWATSCYYCKQYDRVIAADDDLMAKIEQVVPIKIDLTEGEKPRIRNALGIEPELRPYLLFLDRKGRIRRGADVRGVWLGHGAEDGIKAAADGLRARLDLILQEADETALETHAAQS